MKRSRFIEGQITYVLRQREAGTRMQDICRQVGVAAAAFY
jgi:putative transposase